MIHLRKMEKRRITSANYITAVNGMLHPSRVMQEHDFLYILDGSWEVYEENERYELKTDDLLILCAGRHHYGKRLCNPGNRHMYFHVLPLKEEQMENNPSAEEKRTENGITEDAVNMDEMETGGEEADSIFLRSNSLLHCQNMPKVREYFRELIAAYWSEKPEREERMTLLFNLILCELSELQSETGSMESNSVLAQVRQKIYSSPQTFFSAGEMAAEFYICPRTLNNRFRAACGKTFCAYQMDMKLEMVREFLLHQPEAKLHEAAVNFGFYDEFHLSRAFKKKYGYPPSKVRGV